MHDKQSNTRPATAHIPPFGLRMQPELRAAIEAAAKESGRSLNAEIAFRLEESLRPVEPTAQLAAERRKLELVMEYLDWCQAHGNTPEKSFTRFCDFYNNPDRSHDGVSNISGIPQISPDYLRELFGVWFLERDARFPHQSADVRHIINAMEARLEARDKALLAKVEQIAKQRHAE